MYNKHFIFSVISLVAVFLASCDNKRVFEEFTGISPKGWNQDTLVSFEFDIEDASVDYNVKFNIRNSANYKYCNLYYRYFLYDSLGNKISTEMREVFLMDKKTGKPLGDGINGKFTNSYPMIMPLRFPKKGKYKINLRHYMRDQFLEEILNVGIRIEKNIK